MERMANRIKEALRQRVESDPKWQGVGVIVSDSSVPGEGEHKIMDFIRNQQSQPGYDINQRHCIYGQVSFPPSFFYSSLDCLYSINSLSLSYSPLSLSSLVYALPDYRMQI